MVQKRFQDSQQKPNPNTKIANQMSNVNFSHDALEKRSGGKESLEGSFNPILHKVFKLC